VLSLDVKGPWGVPFQITGRLSFMLGVGYCSRRSQSRVLGQHPQSFLDWRMLYSLFGPSLANPHGGFEDGSDRDDAP
jgi:hypothetical protein